LRFRGQIFEFGIFNPGKCPQLRGGGAKSSNKSQKPEKFRYKRVFPKKHMVISLRFGISEHLYDISLRKSGFKKKGRVPLRRDQAKKNKEKSIVISHSNSPVILWKKRNFFSKMKLSPKNKELKVKKVPIVQNRDIWSKSGSGGGYPSF